MHHPRPDATAIQQPQYIAPSASIVPQLWTRNKMSISRPPTVSIQAKPKPTPALHNKHFPIYRSRRWPSTKTRYMTQQSLRRMKGKNVRRARWCVMSALSGHVCVKHRSMQSKQRRMFHHSSRLPICKSCCVDESTDLPHMSRMFAGLVYKHTDNPLSLVHRAYAPFPSRSQRD